MFYIDYFIIIVIFYFIFHLNWQSNKSHLDNFDGAISFSQYNVKVTDSAPAI